MKRSEKTRSARLYDRRHAIVHVELLKNAMQMALGGANRDRQPVRNLLIAEPATTTSQHFDFACTQRCVLCHRLSKWFANSRGDDGNPAAARRMVDCPRARQRSPAPFRKNCRLNATDDSSRLNCDWRLSKVTYSLSQEWRGVDKSPLFARPCGRLRAIAGRQLFVDSMKVTFDRADRDRQRC